MLNPILFAAAVATHVAATTTTINVGQSGLTFVPDSVTAAVGDTLVFKFSPFGHSAGTADFANPCSPSANGGFFSGFVTDSSKAFQVLVNSTDPQFVYCAVPGHCAAGMVMAINPSSDQTLAAFKSAASSKSSSSPANVFGGTFASGPGTATTSAPPQTTTSPSDGGNTGGGGGDGYGGSGGSSGSKPNQATGLHNLSVAAILGVAGLVAFLMH